MNIKLSDNIKRILWWRIILATLIIATLITGFSAPYAASATGISITRDLPDIVSLNETFEVTITFIAPEDYFMPALVDVASEDWQVQVDTSWCTPTASESNVTAEGTRAEYIWYDSVNAGTQFTVVYKVRVPPDAVEGTYTFSNGEMGYKIAGGATQHVAITGESELLITNGTRPPADNEEPPTADGEPVINNTPDNTELDNTSNVAADTDGVSGSTEGEIAEIQANGPVQESAQTGGQEINDNPAPSPSPLHYPPAAKSEPINWPVICGIAGGVVLIILFALLLFRRRI